MRKLNTADGFAFCRVITKSGIREELKKIVSRISGEVDVRDVGMETIFTIIEALSSVGEEQEIYQFLSAPLECKPEEVASMELTEFVDTLKKIAEMNDIKSFFGYVSAILKKN